MSDVLQLCIAESKIAELEQQLANTQAREAELRKGLELYANQDKWRMLAHSREAMVFVTKLGEHGYEPAQERLEKVKGMEGGGAS